MLVERLHKAWRARERAIPITPVLSFGPEGLTLGAGTVVVPAQGPRRLTSLQGRVLALLSAAYGRSVSPAVLRHIERAAKYWRQGEDALAAIHLAFTGLGTPQEPWQAACRLFFADELMKAGASPRTIFEALDLAAPSIETIEKLYNPLEPRVLPGNPHPGEWTKQASGLLELTAEQAASLGRFALRFLGRVGPATTFLGVVLIPSSKNTRTEGEVSGLPRGRYAWDPEQGTLSLTYEGADGQQRTVLAHGDLDGVFRDERGKAIGRTLPDGTVAFDLHALPSAPARDDEPKLCPDPGWDKESGKKGWDYQWYVAKIVNPPPDYPTPWGFGYELLRPDGKAVSFDDCQHRTGMMVEAKGPGYAKLLTKPWGPDSLGEQWLDQSAKQLAALGGRELTWVFAEPEAADFARKIFTEAYGDDPERIHIVVEEWRRTKQ